MTIIIALDIGGTQMRAAVFPTDSDSPSSLTRIPTYANGETSLDRLVGLIRQVMPPDEIIQSIGIAVPGPIDPATGMILTAPNLPEWVGIPIPEQLQSILNVPVFLGNDANLAALGEWHYGAGQGHHDLLYLTISTGIGGGVISDDRLLVGGRGLGAELGHVTILPDGPVCSCGQRGHLEALSSGPGIAAFVAEQLGQGRESILTGQLDAKQVAEAARLGDALAKEAFERAGYYLGLMIANYLMIFNPSIVVLGGGVSMTGDLLLEPVRKTVQLSVLSKHYLQDLVITQAALGDDAGLYGALALAREGVNGLSA
jgi:glucokinase